MNVYMTEEEQVEAMKQWWSKYGTYLLWGVAIVLLIFSGFQWWQKRESSIKGAASMAYQRVIYANNSRDEALLEAKIKDIETNFNKTIYSDAVKLLEARHLVEGKQYEKAIERLKSIVNEKGEDSVFKQLARFRLARLYGELNETGQAMTLIHSLEKTTYAKGALELKGDLLEKNGNIKEAKAAYQQALKTKGEAKDGPYLNYKLERLNKA